MAPALSSRVASWQKPISHAALCPVPTQIGCACQRQKLPFMSAAARPIIHGHRCRGRCNGKASTAPCSLGLFACRATSRTQWKYVLGKLVAGAAAAPLVSVDIPFLTRRMHRDEVKHFMPNAQIGRLMMFRNID